VAVVHDLFQLSIFDRSVAVDHGVQASDAGAGSVGFEERLLVLALGAEIGF